MPLTNSQFDQVMLEYSERRLANTRIQEARREEVYRQIPEMSAIDDAISSASVDAAKKRLAGGDRTDLASYHALIREKKDRRAALLEQNGYPRGYLDPIYTCPICRDTGFVDGQRCVCFKQASIRLLSRESNLEEILRQENFDHFSMSYYSKQYRDPVTGKSSYDLMTAALDQARGFIDTFDTEFRNLLLYGGTGLGKTFLSHCIAKEILEQNKLVVYFSATDFFDMVSDRHFERDPDAEVLYARALSADLVILDDLGTEVPNSFSTSALFSFLNSRIAGRRSCIISTNLPLDKFQEIYGERIFSRIMSCYKFLAFAGEDIRRQKRLVTS